MGGGNPYAERENLNLSFRGAGRNNPQGAGPPPKGGDLPHGGERKKKEGVPVDLEAGPNKRESKNRKGAEFLDKKRKPRRETLALSSAMAGQ
jgi:hypothetical protein